MASTVEALKMRLRDATNRLTEVESQVARQQVSMAQLANELAADADKQSALPGWLDHLTFYGDLRLRGEQRCYGGNAGDLKRYNLARYRLRAGFKKTWLDGQMEIDFRMVSGANSDPTSTNETLTGQFGEKSFGIDRAYAKYEPKCLPGLTVIGGKMPNPLVSTNLVWDTDVNPEGFWAQYKHKGGPIEPFVNAGYFILDDSRAADGTVTTATVQAFQVGFDWKVAKDVRWISAATYYNWDNYQDDYRAANGNDVFPPGHLAAEGFRTINLTNKVDFAVCGLPVGAYLDWVHNCGDSDSRPGYTDQSDGYSTGIKVGKNKKKGDWSAGYRWAYIEANCTPGAFNDSDFAYSNRKGHVLSATYNLHDFVTIGAEVFLVRRVVDTAGSDDTFIDAFVDLIWKF